MKKLVSLFVVLILSLGAVGVFADEEQNLGDYPIMPISLVVPYDNRTSDKVILSDGYVCYYYIVSGTLYYSSSKVLTDYSLSPSIDLYSGESSSTPEITITNTSYSIENNGVRVKSTVRVSYNGSNYYRSFSVLAKGY